MLIPLYVTILRLLIPLSIFRWPLLGVLASVTMDLNDWQLIIMNFQNEGDYVFYQNWDKALDLYYMIFAVVMTYQWKDRLAQKLAIGLFLYRLVGDILFWTTQDRTFLFLFPNFFEIFFIFYLLFVFIFKKTKLITSWKVGGLLLIILGIPKLVHEYFLHIIQKQPWQLYNLGEKVGFSGWTESNINFYTQGLAFYILPFVLGLYLVRRLQSRSH